jgi:hypothetical protein
MTIAMEVWNEAKKNEEYFASNEERSAYIHDTIVERVAKLTTELVEQVGSSYDATTLEGMLLGINKAHRYTQQEFWNAMATICRKYSSQDENRYFDGRNINAKELTNRMANAAQI